jgi:senataxin
MLVDSDQIGREVAHYAALTNAGSSSSGGAVVPYSGVSAVSAVVSPDLALRDVAPVAFFDVYTGGGETRAGKSFKNEAEGRYIISLLEQMHAPHASSSSETAVHRLSVAIITPYKAQVRLLQDMLRASSAVAAIQSRRRALGSELVIEVNSIDGFQGREKDVVLFSCVRSNGSSGGGGGGGNHKSIGFVADERRMNVAITRAKKALLIVGDRHTLRRDKLWEGLLDSLRERGLVRDTGKKK